MMTPEESAAVWSEATQTNQREMAEENKLLQDAKEKAPAGKEPFDIEMLGNLYDLTSEDRALRLTPEKIRWLEVQYYLRNPNIMTLKEFAQRRELLDSHNVG